MNILEKDLLNYFSDWNLSKLDHDYLTSHARRFKFLLETIESILSKFSNRDNISLLDIGPSFQTFLMEKYFPKVKVNSLGRPFSDPAKAPEGLIDFDLNNSQDKKSWPETKTYDVVVMAEVLEYLYLPPEYVFEFIKSLIKPGGFFIMQVSNGLALHKRLNFLFGKKICGKVISENENFGHLREYSIEDLILLGNKQGLNTHKWFIKNYYKNNFLIYLLAKNIFQFHKNFNEGITIIYQKPN